jgi:PTS hybrid protein
VAVGIVFVSHSERIAAGLVELAAQMAPSVALEAAGGTDEGGIGTSYEKVEGAIGRADGGQGVLVIGDLGSAIMTAETAVELLDPPPAGGVLVLDVPLVEGGVAAAVAAEGGGDLTAVAAAARTAAGTPAEDAGRASEPASGTAFAEVVLTDPEGLHARPAAELVKLAGRFVARVQVNGKDARSLLGILALGLRQGDRVRIEAVGPDAADAVDAVRELLESTPG